MHSPKQAVAFIFEAGYGSVVLYCVGLNFLLFAFGYYCQLIPDFVYGEANLSNTTVAQLAQCGQVAVLSAMLLDRRCNPPSSAIYYFLASAAALGGTAVASLLTVSDVHKGHLLIGTGMMLTLSIALTYGVGGKLLNRQSAWNFFQPGMGGFRFVSAQTIAWVAFGLCMVLSNLPSFCSGSATP